MAAQAAPYSTLPSTSAIFASTGVPHHFQGPGAFHVALNARPSESAIATGLRNDVTVDTTLLKRAGASSNLAFPTNAVH